MQHHLGLGQAAGCIRVNESLVLGVLVKGWGPKIDLLTMLLEVSAGVMEAAVYDA